MGFPFGLVKFKYIRAEVGTGAAAYTRFLINHYFSTHVYFVSSPIFEQAIPHAP